MKCLNQAASPIHNGTLLLLEIDLIITDVARGTVCMDIQEQKRARLVETLVPRSKRSLTLLVDNSG